MSLVTSIFDMGQLIGGPLFGAIIQVHGYSAAFGAAAIIAALGLIVFTRWDRDALRDARATFTGS